MSAPRVLARGRMAAESLMLDHGKALRPTGEKEYVGGKDVEQYVDLFASRCKMQDNALQPREVEVGARTSVEALSRLDLPATTPPLSVGDVWEFTAVHPMSLARVGQRVRVLGPAVGTLKTAARYPVEEVLS